MPRTRRRRRVVKKQRGGQVEGLQFPQTSRLTVKFGTVEAAGQALQLATVQEKPVVQWSSPPTETYITFIVFDPNATAKSWLHWLVVNCERDGPLSGDESMEWAPPAPPAGTGLHTYYFATFSHQYPIHVEGLKERGYFNIGEFVKKYVIKPLSLVSIRAKK